MTLTNRYLLTGCRDGSSTSSLCMLPFGSSVSSLSFSSCSRVWRRKNERFSLCPLDRSVRRPLVRHIHRRRLFRLQNHERDGGRLFCGRKEHRNYFKHVGLDGCHVQCLHVSRSLRNELQ